MPLEPIPAGTREEIRPLTDVEFSLFQKLIYRESGICLTDAKKPLLIARLQKRISDLGLRSFGAYYQHLKTAGPSERVLLLDRVSTNETHFFREPAHFEYLTNQVYPKWHAEAFAHEREKSIRIWSAACSTGEEPFTIAMTLLDQFPPAGGWTLEVLASDISTRALAHGRRAVWKMDQADEIPGHFLRRFMLRGVRAQEGKFRAGPDIRGIVKFERVNLIEPVYPVQGIFDVIFCRNILIYFDLESKTRVIEHLANYLAPKGLLLIGHAESLAGVATRLKPIAPTIYMLPQKRDPSKSGAFSGSWRRIRRPSDGGSSGSSGTDSGSFAT